MKLPKETMKESGTIDYLALLSAVEMIKLRINPYKSDTKYSVLLFDSVYFIMDYKNTYKNHECPSRYSLLSKSDVVFRIVADQIEIIKSRIDINTIREVFESRGIVVYRVCAPSTYDEE